VDTCGEWPKGVKELQGVKLPSLYSNWDLLLCRAAFFLMDIPVENST